MDGLPPLSRLVHFFRLPAAFDRFESWLAEERSLALDDVLAKLAA